jgi:hypothetical protein
MPDRVASAIFYLCMINVTAFGSCLPNRFQSYTHGYHWDTLSFPSHKFSLLVCNDDSLGRSNFVAYGGEEFETTVQMDTAKVVWEDIDFDGIDDALVLVDVASNNSYEAFIFNPANKQYVHFKSIGNTGLDKKRKILRSSNHMGGGESSLYYYKIFKLQEYAILIGYKSKDTITVYDKKMNLLIKRNRDILEDVTEEYLESSPSTWKYVTQEPRQELDWSEFWKMREKPKKSNITPNNK